MSSSKGARSSRIINYIALQIRCVILCILDYIYIQKKAYSDERNKIKFTLQIRKSHSYNSFVRIRKINACVLFYILCVRVYNIIISKYIYIYECLYLIKKKKRNSFGVE